MRCKVFRKIGKAIRFVGGLVGVGDDAVVGVGDGAVVGVGVGVLVALGGTDVRVAVGVALLLKRYTPV